MIRRVARLGAALAIALLGTAGASAQDAPINTDRPSFTSAPRVVGAGVVQIESGVVVQRDEVGEVTASTVTVPDALVRLGLSRQLELRVGVAGWIRSDTDRPRDEATSSASDTAVALEYQFAGEDGFGADLAVIAGASVPTGGAASSGTVDPFVRLVWSRTVSDAATLGGTFNWSRPTVPGPSQRERLRTLEGSLVFGHGLGGSWSGFVEAVVRHLDVDDDAVAWVGNVGVLKTFGPDWQLDAWFGRGLNDAAPDWAFGTGLSFRFRR